MLVVLFGLLLSAVSIAQPPLVRRLQTDGVPATLGRINGQWHLTGYQSQNAGWPGFHTVLDDLLAPIGPAKSWPGASYHEAISTHGLANGNWLTFGRTGPPSIASYLYFVEHDAQGTIHAAHKWVDTTNTLTTINYAHAYNADSSKLLTVYQSMQVKGFVCFDQNGELLWAKRLNSGNMLFSAVVAADDGGWYGLGQRNFGNYNFDPILVKLNAQGDQEWTRRYIMDGADESIQHMTATSDGGLLFAATAIIDSVPQPKPAHATLLRVDQDGALLWYRMIGRAGGLGNYGSGSAIELSDGTILWAGSAKDSLTNAFFDANIFFLHLDADGVVLTASRYAHPGGGDGGRVKFLNNEGDHPILTAWARSGGSYAMELISLGPDLLPPCDTSPFIYAEQPRTITTEDVAQSTSDFILLRDTLLLSDPPFTLATELACMDATGIDEPKTEEPGFSARVADGHLFVDIFGDRSTGILWVHDALGRTIAQHDLNDYFGQMVIQLPTIANGMLVVSLLNGQGERRTLRVVVVP